MEVFKEIVEAEVCIAFQKTLRILFMQAYGYLILKFNAGQICYTIWGYLILAKPSFNWSVGFM